MSPQPSIMDGLTSPRFPKYAFPVLRNISRLQFGFTSIESVPERTVLESAPTHLLAAVYDDQLAVTHGYQHPPSGKIGRIVYKATQEALHRPRLSTLKAAWRYLHKASSDRCRCASSDTPFIWSFMGSIVGLVIARGYILNAACLASRHENKDFAKGFSGVYSSKTTECIAPGTSPLPKTPRVGYE